MDANRSAWYYLQKKIPIIIVESYFDESLVNKIFNNISEACSFFNCPYHIVHKAIKLKLYIKGEYRVEYLDKYM